LAAKQPAKKQETKEEVEVSEEALSEFGEKCEAAVKDAKANVSKLAKEVSSFSKDELSTVHPVSCLLAPMLRFCRQKEDEEVIKTVKRFAPVLTSLIDGSTAHRFKVKVLCEAQRIAHEMGLPRLSPASALIEVFFDGLYQAEVVEEQYFNFWTESNDDTPGKISAMFQMTHFLMWLRNPDDVEDPDSDADEEGEEEEAEEDEEEEDDLSDIEANVPQRAGGRPVRP